MNGRFILDLPTSLSANIITEWLSVKNRVRFDSAHCQASVREEFLQLNRSPELSVKSWVPDRTHLTYQALVTWALLREVYVEKLSIETEGYFNLYNVYLQTFGNRVFALRLNSSIKFTSLVQCAVACHNLLVLKLYNRKLSASLRDVFVCCKRLREFSSFGHFYYSDPDPSEPPLTSAHLDTLVCCNLKYLELIYCDADLVAAFLRMAVVVEVVCLKNIPDDLSPVTSTLSLREITIDECFIIIVTRGQHIENLVLQWCNVSERAMRCLCKFPNLRALDLSGATFETTNYLSVLASSCGERLTELLLLYCWPKLSLDQMQLVLPRFTQLTSFSCRLANYDPSAFDMSSFSRFRKLQIHYSGGYNDKLLTQLTEYCYVNIEELSLRTFALDPAAEQLNILVSTCTNLRSLNVEDSTTVQLCYTDEQQDRWKSLRPGLVVGGDCEHRLNVFTKYECAGAL